MPNTYCITVDTCAKKTPVSLSATHQPVHQFGQWIQVLASRVANGTPPAHDIQGSLSNLAVMADAAGGAILLHVQDATEQVCWAQLDVCCMAFVNLKPRLLHTVLQVILWGKLWSMMKSWPSV